MYKKNLITIILSLLIIILLINVASAMESPNDSFAQIYEDKDLIVFLDLSSAEYCNDVEYPRTFAVLGDLWIYCKTESAKLEVVNLYNLGLPKGTDWAKVRILIQRTEGEPLILYTGRVESRFRPTLSRIFDYTDDPKKYILKNKWEYNYKWSIEVLRLMETEVRNGKSYPQFTLE